MHILAAARASRAAASCRGEAERPIYRERTEKLKETLWAVIGRRSITTCITGVTQRPDLCIGARPHWVLGSFATADSYFNAPILPLVGSTYMGKRSESCLRASDPKFKIVHVAAKTF